jgi:hypothetical protein
MGYAERIALSTVEYPYIVVLNLRTREAFISGKNHPAIAEGVPNNIRGCDAFIDPMTLKNQTIPLPEYPRVDINLSLLHDLGTIRYKLDTPSICFLAIDVSSLEIENRLFVSYVESAFSRGRNLKFALCEIQFPSTAKVGSCTALSPTGYRQESNQPAKDKKTN